MAVEFYSEEIDFSLSEPERFERWILDVVNTEGGSVKHISYIFCSNAYLLKINQDYLNHDYYTDIISFPYSEAPDPIEGDIFISIEMVQENASKNSTKFHDELLRVMAHGVLHYLGFKDKTDKESLNMRAKEEEMMGLFTI